MKVGDLVRLKPVSADYPKVNDLSYNRNYEVIAVNNVDQSIRIIDPNGDATWRYQRFFELVDDGIFLNVNILEPSAYKLSTAVRALLIQELPKVDEESLVWLENLIVKVRLDKKQVPERRIEV